MNSKLLVLASALTLVVIAVVGLIDAIIDDHAGTAVLFGILAVGIASLARVRASEGTVSMRRDLASWLEKVAPVTGETVDELSDRAVSRLRAGFTQLDIDE